MASPHGNRSNNAPQVSDETLRELLSVQKQELALRLKEVERDNSEINLNKSVAQQSIEAQERDRKHEREEHTKRQKTHQNFILIATCAVLVFAGYALHAGQSAIVMDMVKVFVAFIGGAGYTAYRFKKKSGGG